jgi:hypothetical protein
VTRDTEIAARPLFRSLRFFLESAQPFETARILTEEQRREQRDNSGGNSKIISDISATVPLCGRRAHSPAAAAQKRMAHHQSGLSSVPSDNMIDPDCQAKNAILIHICCF